MYEFISKAGGTLPYEKYIVFHKMQAPERVKHDFNEKMQLAHTMTFRC